MCLSPIISTVKIIVLMQTQKKISKIGWGYNKQQFITYLFSLFISYHSKARENRKLLYLIKYNNLFILLTSIIVTIPLSNCMSVYF